ncbi:MAG: hypothetical protein R3B67_03845 [Phycisphaerales bacterium]
MAIEPTTSDHWARDHTPEPGSICSREHAQPEQDIEEAGAEEGDVSEAGEAAGPAAVAAHEGLAVEAHAEECSAEEAHRDPDPSKREIQHVGS